MSSVLQIVGEHLIWRSLRDQAQSIVNVVLTLSATYPCDSIPLYVMLMFLLQLELAASLLYSYKQNEVTHYGNSGNVEV